jgi:hypothetical protein
MSTPAFDLRARRAAYTRDFRTAIENLCDGATTLHAEVCGWPFRVNCEGTIAGVERQLGAMQALLIEMRGSIPKDAA